MTRKLAKSECSEYPLARTVSISGGAIHMELRDGRRVTAPIKDFRILALAPKRPLRLVQVIGAGSGIEWPDLGVELGVGGLTRKYGAR